MTVPALIALVAVTLVAGSSIAIGTFGVRVARSTSDFLVASRTVGPISNASAISGEYLSAVSFLGLAAFVLVEGVDGLWAGVAFAAGYLALVLFVAAPLRRSGAYTVPDFAEMRLGSPALRRACTGVVLLIGWLYLLVQLEGAAIALAALTGLELTLSMILIGLVMVLAVIGGGMRSVTFVQSFQYWLKLAALAVPAFVVLAVFLRADHDFDQPLPPTFPMATAVDVAIDVTLAVDRPVQVSATGQVDGRQVDSAVDGPLEWAPGTHEVAAGAKLTFAEGASVPVPAGSPITDRAWLEPDDGTDGWRLVGTYSLIIAGFLGVMGLPHILVRFYTNRDGRDARRTAVAVLAMVGGAYVLAVMLGVFARLYTPALLATGRAEAAVLLLPSAALGQGWAAWSIGALVAAGAAAAFLASSTGLLVSLAGVVFTDVLRGRARDVRLATALSAVVPIGLTLLVTRVEFTLVVPIVFTIAASTFCPLLVLGIWWRRLTATGAIAGVLTGGLLSSVAVVLALAHQVPDGGAWVLLARPAVITVPAAFLVMIAVSLATRRGVPADVDNALLRLHAPERLGLLIDRMRHDPER